MEILFGVCTILVVAVCLTVVDVGTNNKYLEPWNRKLWPTHAHKAGVYSVVGLAVLIGIGGVGLAADALSTSISAGTVHGTSLGAGVLGEMISAKWVWHRELRRDEP